MSDSANPYAKLRDLLEKETFPHRYPYRFVGKNTPEFREGVVALRAKFPSLVQTSERLSKGDRHVALGFILEANDVDEIIAVLEAIAILPDLQLSL